MALCDEDRVIKALLHSPMADVLPIVNMPIYLDLFPGRRAEAEWIGDYVLRFGVVPKPSHFQKHFPSAWDGSIRPEPLLHTLDDLQLQLMDTIKAKHAQELTEAFDKKPKDVENHISLLEKFAFTLRQAVTKPNAANSDTDLRTQQLLAEIAKDPLAALKRIATGLVPLDRELGGGMGPGQFIVLSALVSLGKTYLLCKIAENIRRSGKRVLFVPLEMTTEDIQERCLALRFKLNVDWYIKREKPATETKNDIDWYKDLLEQRLKLEKADQCQGKVFVEAPVGPCNAMLIKGWIRQYAADVVLIDAAQDIWDNKKTSAKVERLYNAVEQLKMLAVEAKLPIFVTVQLQAAVEKQGITKGNLSNISWSQAFAQKAHALFTMLGDRSTGVRDVTTDKNRDGNVGRKWEVTMKFPEVEIDAHDLQPVGIVLKPEDVFDSPEDIAKLFEDPPVDSAKQVPPPRPHAPSTPPASATPAQPAKETPYQERRRVLSNERTYRKLKRNAPIRK